jgi:opacity protein-like surface antigen
MDGEWHFVFAPYLWASGMKGTVGVSNVVDVPVDVSFGDALEKLDFGFLGRFEGRKDRIGFGADLAYLNLGAEVTGPVAGQVGLGADLRSLTAEGLVTYRAVNDAKGGFADLLAGARHLGNRAALAAERDGDEIAETEKTLDWVDALVGARFRLSLGEKVGLHGRADIAGFGSDFTWNLLGGLDVALGKSWQLRAGYRYMDVDYDDGQGLERRVWQITYQGPYVAVAKIW